MTAHSVAQNATKNNKAHEVTTAANTFTPGFYTDADDLQKKRINLAFVDSGIIAQITNTILVETDFDPDNWLILNALFAINKNTIGWAEMCIKPIAPGITAIADELSKSRRQMSETKQQSRVRYAERKLQALLADQVNKVTWVQKLMGKFNKATGRNEKNQYKLVYLEWVAEAYYRVRNNPATYKPVNGEFGTPYQIAAREVAAEVMSARSNDADDEKESKSYMSKFSNKKIAIACKTLAANIRNLRITLAQAGLSNEEIDETIARCNKFGEFQAMTATEAPTHNLVGTSFDPSDLSPHNLYISTHNLVGTPDASVTETEEFTDRMVVGTESADELKVAELEECEPLGHNNLFVGTLLVSATDCFDSQEPLGSEQLVVREQLEGTLVGQHKCDQLSDALAAIDDLQAEGAETFSAHIWGVITNEEFDCTDGLDADYLKSLLSELLPKCSLRDRITIKAWRSIESVEQNSGSAPQPCSLAVAV